MKAKKGLSLLLVIVMLFGMVPSGIFSVPQAQAASSADVIAIDFAQVAEEIRGESWWKNLEMGSSSDEVMPSDASNAQYEALLDYLESSQNWTINESVSKIANPNASAKRIWLDTEGEFDWALRYYSSWLGNTETMIPRNGLQIDLTVSAQEAGWYQLSVDAFMEGVSSKQIPTGVYPGSGYGMITVNGEVVLEEMSFAGGNTVTTLKGGVVELKEGINEIKIHNTKDFSGSTVSGRRTLALNNLKFSPVEKTDGPVDNLRLDFKAFARKASTQSWWDALGDTNLEDVKVFGHTSSSQDLGDRYDAYNEMLAFMEENECWSIDEGLSKFSDPSAIKRMFLDNSENACGLRYYTSRFSSQNSNYSKLVLNVNLPIGAAGWYEMDMDVIHEAVATTIAQVDGLYSGSGYGDIYVNDTLVCDEFFFGGSANKTYRQLHELGRVYLNDGSNTITIDMTASFVNDLVNGRRAINLCAIEFRSAERQPAMLYNFAKAASLTADGGFRVIETYEDLLIDDVESAPWHFAEMSDAATARFDTAEGAAMLKDGSVSFTLQVDQEGWYVPELAIRSHLNGGTITVSLSDGRVLGVFETAASTKSANHMTLNPVFLQAGEYDITFTTENGYFLWDSLGLYQSEAPELSLFCEEVAGDKQHRTVTRPLYAFWEGSFRESLHGMQLTAVAQDGDIAAAKIVTDPTGGPAMVEITGLKPGETTVTLTAQHGGVSASAQINMIVGEPAALSEFSIGVKYAEKQVARFTTQDFELNMIGDDGEAIYAGEAQISYEVSEEDIIEIDEANHSFKAMNNGDVTVTATAAAGGVTLTDTVSITVADRGENAFAWEDSSFEGDIGIGHWATYAPGSNAFNWAQAEDDGTGNMAMKITVNPNVSYTGCGSLGTEVRLNNGYFAQLHPGHMYEISARMKVDSLQKAPDARSGYLFVLQMYDYSANLRSDSNILNEVFTDVSLSTSSTDGWVDIVFNVRAPLTCDNTIYAMPRIVLRPTDSRDYSVTGWQGSVWFDDFQITEVGLSHVELELQEELTDTITPTNVYIRPVTTTGNYVDIDADHLKELVSIVSTNEDVAEVKTEPARVQYRATKSYCPAASVGLVGLNAQAELVANVTLGGFTKEGRMDMTRTDMADVLRDVQYTLDSFEAAVLTYGETAEGTLSGRSTQLEPMTEEDLRSNGEVYFASSDQSVAVVDQTTGDVTCVGEGTAVITAYAMLDGILKQDSVTLTVADETDLVSIALSSEVDYVTVGNRLQLTASGMRSSGGKAVMTDIPLAYTVSDETVAAVSEEGVLTGLQAGTVTVTATVGVMRQAITASKTLNVIDSEQLPGSSIVIDFTNGRLSNIQTATLANDDVQINRSLSYLGGQNMTPAHKYGFAHNIPAGESMTFDFVVRRSGWYTVEISGGLYSNGNLSDIFVDKNYAGTIDFHQGKNGAPYSASCIGNTIWLEAGDHTIRFNAVTAGVQYLGKITLRTAQDPNPIRVQVQTAKQELLVGEQMELVVSAEDANSKPFYLKKIDKESDYVNYILLEPSSSLTLQDSVVTGVNAGSGQIFAHGVAAQSEFEHTVDVEVVSGTVAYAQVSAEQTTVKPDAEPFALMVKVFGVDGTELSDAFEIVFAGADETIATVSADGIVTLTGEQGSVLVTATVSEGSRQVEAQLWITVTEGKTQPTVYTYDERRIAQENVLRYSWAWEECNDAVANADYVVEHLDQFYDMLMHEGLPRSARIVYRSDNENAAYCPMCKTNLQAIYSHYPWIVDPIENPWKITCPVCDSDFPSNDFESYYKSGLDERGVFRADQADPQYLVNELYPEMGEGWGVDDGTGYQTGQVTAAGAPVVYTYIAYYVHCVLCTLGDMDINDIGYALDSLREAYIYTGNEKYGSAGAILLDRVADIYPDYDLSRYSTHYSNSDGGNGQGKFTGSIWEGAIVGQYLAKAADAFWPAMDNPDVVEYLRGRAVLKGVEPEEITPEYLRNHVDENILLQIADACMTYKNAGNFGMSQACMAYAAVALDRMPETEEMIDWTMRYGEIINQSGKYTVTGGNVMYNLVNLVDRDGFGDEVSSAYLSLWASHLSNVADALDGYTAVEGVDLWRNSKFVSIYKGYAQMLVCGRMAPLVGETGGVQSVNLPMKSENLLLAYQNTHDPEMAQALYFVNGNSVVGLHGDIFTENPESIRIDIQRDIETYGELRFNDSILLSGYGIGVFKEGPEKYLGVGVNADEFSAQWMYFGPTYASHAHLEALSMDLYAYGLNLSSTMGYPLSVTTTDPMRMQWMTNTISHNLVVVDDAAQSAMDYGGFPMHFDDAGKVKVMDAHAPEAYAQTDIYRRTLVNVAAPNGQSYTVDFFRVLGGEEHVYSFHVATMQQPAMEGLEMTRQPMGTYAGADVPFGVRYTQEPKDVTMNTGSGYSWLDDIYRDSHPDTTFTLDYPVEDFRHQLPTSAGIHLKMTMLSEEPMTEVALANGHPPQNGSNPEHVEYVLVRRSGENGMDSLFTTIFEPYQGQSQVVSSELVEVTLTDGTELATDKTIAIKVTMLDGREDYIVYATNYDCTYRVDDRFDFRGFTGVCSYYGNALVYAYGNETTKVADVIDNNLPAVTGTVTDFTKGLSMDGYTMTVTMDIPVTAEELENTYIYVNNDGERNAAYQIYGAEVTGNTAVLDLEEQTLVRKFVDGSNLSLGYVHNVAEGQSFTIPLSASFDMGTVFNYTTNQVIKAGNKLSLTTGVSGSGVTYAADGLATGMKLDANTGALTWTTSKTNVGRYPITIKAIDADGDVVGTMSFVVYVVSYTGSTYAADACTHTKAVTYTVGNVIETVCPACSTITKAVVEEAEKFDIAGANMTLGNELKLNILVKTSDLTDGTYTAKITHGDTVTEAVFAKYNSSYSYVTYTVSAKQMADTITVEVYDENGNAVSKTYETSVRTYAMNLLGNAAMTAKVKTLVVDMLNYGSEAQIYFGYNESDLANTLLTEEQKALATESVACTNRQVKGTNFYGTNLTLGDKILLNMFFKNVTEDMYAKVLYTDYTGKVKTIQKDLTPYSGSVYKVVVDDIVLADAFSTVTVTVYNADDTVHGTGTDSVESYIARTGSSTLNEAIMKFAYSAKQYLG